MKSRAPHWQVTHPTEQLLPKENLTFEPHYRRVDLLQWARERNTIPANFMDDMVEAQQRARDSVVFALKIWNRDQTTDLPKFPRVEPRPAIKTKEQDLDAALEEVMSRFPRTLDYLAK